MCQIFYLHQLRGPNKVLLKKKKKKHLTTYLHIIVLYNLYQVSSVHKYFKQKL